MLRELSLPNGIRKAAPGELGLLANVTAEAFANDPVNRWAMGGPRLMERVFGVLAREIHGPRGLCLLAGMSGEGRADAAAMWAPAGMNRSLPGRAMPGLVLRLLLGGGPNAVRRTVALGEGMDRHHPHEPHLYLFTIGTRAAGRGRGLGKALMAPVLETADRSGLPVYLENTNPANFGFYRQFGFEARPSFEVGGSPPLQPLWRVPGSG